MSEVWKQFEKIMSEKGLVKTADKKDESYNVVPDKAGPDTLVEETGYELVEIAHPDQIQVANSRLNDGVVENGVERQKVMMEVALRNPRGVLAELMKTLVKAANKLEEDMTEESLKMAGEVDDFLVVLAQSQVVLNENDAKQVYLQRLSRLKPLAEEALSRFDALDWSTLGFGRNEDVKYGESVVKDATGKLQEFLKDPFGMGDKFAQYVNQFYKMVANAIRQSKDWGDDQNEALVAWNQLKATGDEMLAKGHKAPPVPAGATGPLISKNPEAHESDKASKAPAKHYSVTGPDVEKLQSLLGVKADGKFGPKTFAAVMAAAKDNYNLEMQLKSSPHYSKGYDGWDNAFVQEAVHNIEKFQRSEAPAPKTPEKTPAEQHFTANGLGIPYENE